MTDDLVKRYELEQFKDFDGVWWYGSMEPCKNGDWVSYNDYAKLVDRIKELEANLKIALMQ
jgi:hypothetical protein